MRSTVVVKRLACDAVADAKAGRQQFPDALVQIDVHWPALALCDGRLGHHIN